MPRTSRRAWSRSASSDPDFGVEARRVSWPGARRGSARPRYRRRSIRTAAALSWADGPWSIQLSGADLKTPERSVAVRLPARDGVDVVFQGRRESIDRVDRRLRAEPRGVRQPRGVSVRSDAARGQERVLHPRRERGERHSRRRLPPDRRRAHATANRRSARSRSATCATCHAARGARSASAATSPATRCPPNLAESYGSPLSFHVFAAVSRPRRSSPAPTFIEAMAAE